MTFAMNIINTKGERTATLRRSSSRDACGSPVYFEA
jgi:hypothetical protein